ncbi:MAG: hypothetical protein ONB44_20145 [candidate division KSB1 bacterium]|nr:hypothetical protein [candidate division KSB1 bacterium]MDZ7304441.1 hypothetical protein [candidate division KSB1 bacterium]MDZ7310934.1 hypothetical protein [candidate division KSB1 bacterium]
MVIRFEQERDEAAAISVLATVLDSQKQLTEKYRLVFSTPIEIHLTQTTAEFCQRTGSAWWQGAIYQDHVIYIQPVRVLQERGILETTLRHELTHQLLDETTRGNCPRWLCEALAIFNSGEIVTLKPAPQKFRKEELTWKQLNRHLKTIKNKEESERIYFQLYHLGRFFEQNFASNQISALMTLLGEGMPFEQACQQAFGSNARKIEQRWLQYSRKTLL